MRRGWNLRRGFPAEQAEKTGGFHFVAGTLAWSGDCLAGDNGGPNIMAYERNPNDPYRPNVDLADDELQRMRLDRELQADPELGEGPASGGKVAMFAIAVAVVLGAVFYGLNNSSMNPAGTGSTATAPATQNTAQQTPAAPPGMRDLTPRSNTEPGMTTGAAPARPQQPAANAPTGQEVDRSAKPAPDAPAK